ncbi:MAG: NAD(+) diphosphatase [Merismopedia sp. SIO2A8]|nr:NAD(+) diphosphatase [Merismopedia sp. SIO2A8]
MPPEPPISRQLIFPERISRQPFALPSHFSFATDSSRDDDLEQAWWFVCQGSNLLVMASDDVDCPSLPSTALVRSLGLNMDNIQILGHLNQRLCVAIALPKDTSQDPSQNPTKNISIPAGGELRNLRSLYGELREEWFAIAARAVQIVEWDRTHRYCGHCATPMIQMPTEWAKECPNCALRQYPRLSPAVIMLVHRGDELLLARAPRFRPGMYSVLAGFVEPGESLEEAVAREVHEEVGIHIKNIRYFGSQPWPFPNSLMIGFVAEYDSGILTPDLNEIEAAAWFKKQDIPPVPGKLSIARKLIDWFVASEKGSPQN